MRFLVDAQLPLRLKDWLEVNGFDAIHTSGLPKKNRTPDIEIAGTADEMGRILITKDSDFLTLKILRNKPRHILSVTTGNIDNDTLIRLFEANLKTIETLFDAFEIVELGNSFVVGKNL
jgi:predicted nuclease of predicted toxin-antitoxin system